MNFRNIRIGIILFCVAVIPGLIVGGFLGERLPTPPLPYEYDPDTLPPCGPLLLYKGKTYMRFTGRLIVTESPRQRQILEFKDGVIISKTTEPIEGI